MATERWQPDRSTPSNPWPTPGLATAIGRGLRGRCPACGLGLIFNGFLTVAAECSVCTAPLGLARADDAPPYFTILIVGHIVIPLLFIVDRWQQPPVWIMWAIFVPLTLALTLSLIRPIKGGTVGLMLNLNMLKSDPSAV
jgi:uncharacterized protein (DUF983 family)